MLTCTAQRGCSTPEWCGFNSACHLEVMMQRKPAPTLEERTATLEVWRTSLKVELARFNREADAIGSNSLRLVEVHHV